MTSFLATIRLEASDPDDANLRALRAAQAASLGPTGQASIYGIEPDERTSNMSRDAAVRSLHALFDRYGAAEVRATMERLFAGFQAAEDATNYQEASGKAVSIFDPETGRRSLHGPFPKEGNFAEVWAAAHEANWNAANKGDGPDLVYTVELLFEPT